jgi:hypothetical protein
VVRQTLFGLMTDQLSTAVLALLEILYDSRYDTHTHTRHTTHDTRHTRVLAATLALLSHALRSVRALHTPFPPLFIHHIRSYFFLLIGLMYGGFVPAAAGLRVHSGGDATGYTAQLFTTLLGDFQVWPCDRVTV